MGAPLWATIYFVLFIVVGGFFTLNIFAGVVIENYRLCKVITY